MRHVVFQALGKAVSRGWWALLIGWALVLVGTWALAPRWDEVAEDGEFAFLPKDAPSRAGERLLKRAFPGDSPASSVVIVLSREASKGLLDEDRTFIKNELEPALKALDKPGEGTSRENVGEAASRQQAGPRAAAAVIERIRTLSDPVSGPLLTSEDGRATLVVVNLAAEFREARSRRLVAEIESSLGRLRQEHKVPKGLEITLTGSAAVGRDLSEAKRQSARAIESWTIWLIVLLLLAIYRAPLVALIPLATIFIAMKLAIQLLAILARAGYVSVFRGLEVYSTVVVYGAGVDYCLFLIARYREELGRGFSPSEALAHSVERIGAALAASAGTVIVGIGMLSVAKFRKFGEAGIAISFGLLVMLLATLTLTPALLRLCGRRAFWPRREQTAGTDPAQETDGDDPASGIERVWEHTGRLIQRRPVVVWLAAVAVMLPFAVIAVRNADHLSFGLIQELPARAPSVAGTRKLQEHFPAGTTGGLVLLIENRTLDFAKDDGIRVLTTLVDRLQARRRELKLSDIRSVPAPLGITRRGEAVISKSTAGFAGFGAGIVRKKAIEHYVTGVGELRHHVARVDLTLAMDPFSGPAMDLLDNLDRAVRSELPGSSREDTRTYFTGVTSSLRDLRKVAEGDRLRISVAVTLSVLVVLVVLLRRLMLPLYLIGTVLFSYLVTLGVTYVAFRRADPAGFEGLDWTVPIFLFALLVAVGEDYNIFLVTRVDEESGRFGPVRGIVEALRRTGGIISSCGVIMAGTFASLVVGGAITSMRQLGFALAFGVLLDTFVIRPVLVPCFLVIANDGRFASWRSPFRRMRTPERERVRG